MMDRRTFLQGAGAAAVAGGSALAAPGGSARTEKVPRNLLGKTGVDVPMIGFGGIVVRDVSPKEAAAYVEEAFQAGVDYFDVAPTYGNAEERLGPALEPFRDRAFLACKTHHRDKKGAEQDLHASLKRLRTDHFDLYQLHGLTDVEKDVEAAFRKGGAMEAVIEAKRKGIIRFAGFSAHSPQAALKAMQEYEFDTVMYPINFVCHFRSRFEVDVVNEARKRGMGVIALKTHARQKWPDAESRKQYPKCWYQPIDDAEVARLAVCWTLSRGVNVAIPPGDIRLFRLALRSVVGWRAPTPAEIARLERLAGRLNPIFST